jgi:hypothetical protein
MNGSYFSASEHQSFLAFNQNQPDSQAAYDKLAELHKLLHRRFRDLNWDLHAHWNKADLISNTSIAGGHFAGLALPYFRSREQATLVERLMRDGIGPQSTVSITRHPVIEVRVTPEHFAVELVVSPSALYDQENIVGKLLVQRQRATLRNLISRMTGDFCFGFWSGTHLDEMHVTTAQMVRGNVLDDWMSTFQDGQDCLRIGAWYQPEDSALDASRILSEVTQRIGSLYNLYTYMLWTSNNDFRSFYGRATSANTARDMRM